jgi:hypothetical protein
MTRTIYALQTKTANEPQNFAPLFAFETWDKLCIPDSALDKLNAGENVEFAENPHYIQNASLDIEDDDAAALFQEIGYGFMTEAQGQNLLYSLYCMAQDVSMYIDLNNTSSNKTLILEQAAALLKLIKKAQKEGAFYLAIL